MNQETFGLLVVFGPLSILVAIAFVYMQRAQKRKLEQSQELAYAKRKMHELANTNAANELYQIKSGLSENPELPELHEKLIAIASNQIVSKEAYQIALDAVESSHGATICRKTALAVGRAYYGSLRPDKRVSMYDEKAIENDINARC